MNKIILASLKKILVEADFKTTKTKFIRQGIDVGLVKTYLEDFKKLRNSRDLGEYKDIDYWGKQPWEDFKKFVDKTKEEKSKTKIKKEEKSEGAELVAENDEWRIYKIKDRKASRLYGSGTRWCITEEDGRYWREYVFKKGCCFYFLISKTKESGDRLFKLSAQVKPDGSVQFWDATDRPIFNYDDPSYTPKEFKLLKIPKFSFDHFFVEDTSNNIIKQIKEKGLTQEINDEILDVYGTSAIKYIADKDFLVFEEYKDFHKFAEDSNSTNLIWNNKIISGDEFMDVEASIHDVDTSEVLNILIKKHLALYKSFIEKLLSTSEFQEYLERVDAEEEAEEGTGKKEYCVDDFVGEPDLVRYVEDYINDEEDSEVSNIFIWATADAIRSATESMLFRFVEKDVRKCLCVLVSSDTYFFDSPIYVGCSIADLDEYGCDGDVMKGISEDLIKLGLEDFRFECADSKDIVEHLVEYHLAEYVS